MEYDTEVNVVLFQSPDFEKLANEGDTYFSLTERYERGVTLSGSATYGYAGKYIFNGVFNYEG